MDNDIVFKTKAFGGFDKGQVMDYVNAIYAEKTDFEKKLAETNIKLMQANDKINGFQSVLNEFDEAKQKLAAAEDSNEALNRLISEKDAEISSLKEENEKIASSAVSDDVLNELDALRTENARLKIEIDKKKDLERQVGAAMLDARVHSESLVEDAKQKASAVTKAVYNAIGETALKIDDLSGGIGEIARNFQKSVEEVELRIKALTGDMSKTAQLLISDSTDLTEPKITAEQVEYDFTAKQDEEITINPEDYGVEGDIEISTDDYNTDNE